MIRGRTLIFRTAAFIRPGLRWREQTDYAQKTTEEDINLSLKFIFKNNSKTFIDICNKNVRPIVPVMLEYHQLPTSVVTIKYVP